VNYFLPVITVAAVSVLLRVLNAHKSAEPAQIESGSAYVMRPSPIERVLAWAGLAMVLGISGSLVVIGVLDRTTSLVVIGVVFGIAFGALDHYLFGEASERIEVSELGVRRFRRNVETYIAWEDVIEIAKTTMIGALVISGKSGARITVNKKLNGIARLMADLRRHLAPGVCESTLKDYRP